MQIRQLFAEPAQVVHLNEHAAQIDTPLSKVPSGQLHVGAEILFAMQVKQLLAFV